MMMNQQATAQYDKELQEVKEYLELINELVGQHRPEQAEALNWGHVGDLQAIKAELHTIYRSLK